MARYKLIKEPNENNKYDKSTIEFVFETIQLEDLLEEFEYFLKACGYVFQGTVDIVEEENGY